MDTSDIETCKVIRRGPNGPQHVRTDTGWYPSRREAERFAATCNTACQVTGVSYEVRLVGQGVD
jgi:hypothetical protein